MGERLTFSPPQELFQPRSQIEDKPEEQSEKQDVPENNAVHQRPSSQEVPTAVL